MREQRKTIGRFSHQESTLAEGRPEKTYGTSLCDTVVYFMSNVPLRMAYGLVGFDTYLKPI
jgi:hypothetical protein